MTADDDQRRPNDLRDGDAGDFSAIMTYDGECGFCTDVARRWRDKIGDELAIVPLQDDSTRPTGLALRELEEAVHLVEADGSVLRGAAAVFRAMALRRRYRWLWWLYRYLPGFRPISEWVYRWVANNRIRASRWTRWLRR